MVRLLRDARGNYVARKRLPDDVKEEYGRQYGACSEAKKTWPASTERKLVERLFHEWLADVEARIAAIKAAMKGEGVPLTRQQARALAGEWYDWFVARHPENDREHWEQLRDQMHDALRNAVGEKRWEEFDNPDELWRDDEKLRKTIRPVLADVGETAQFLAMKKMVPDNEARALFLDFLYADLAAALKRMIRMSDGYYGPDAYRDQFPKFQAADCGETPMQLFERWAAARRPARGTLESWRYVFDAMGNYFNGRSAASITDDEAQEWVNSLANKDRSGHTVRRTYISASRTVFRWALKHKHIPHNPFKEVETTVQKRTRHRETQAFLPHEYRIILTAALAITDTTKPFDAAKRWVPWLCAYTGARAGEITQLRKRDVIEREGVWAIHITPEAGSVKTNTARTVPLHVHLTEQGFLNFVQNHPDGPLFYTPDPNAKSDDPLKQKKPRSTQMRQRVGNWVRELGVSDLELQPNHAWRHTFVLVARRCGISDGDSDAITGRPPANVARGYGVAEFSDMAAAMKKFPRYILE